MSDQNTRFDSACAQVREWLLDDLATPPTSALCDHVATCSWCQAALIAVTAHLLPEDTLMQPVICQQCQGDLAAFIDLERLISSDEAMQTYPHVWAHLWICKDCAETYHAVHILLDTPGSHHDLPKPLPVQTLLLEWGRVLRWQLNQMFGPYGRLGTAWSQSDDELVVAEQTIDATTYTLLVRPQPGPVWDVEMITTPALGGCAIIRYGDQTLRKLIDRRGVARFDPQPASLFTATDGPDLRLSVEPDVRTIAG